MATQYVVTRDDQRTLIQATHIAATQCLARFGVTAAGAPPIDEASLDSTVSPRPVGIVDRQEVATWGYHPKPEPDADSVAKDAWDPSSREIELRQGRTAGGEVVRAVDDQGTALPAGGCDGEATSRVLGGPDWDMFRGQQLFSQAMDRAEADDRLLTAWASWSTCMAAEGYQYATPWDANDDPQWWSAGSEPSHQEIQTAISDLDCRKSSGTTATWVALINAYELQLLDQQGASLAEWADRLRRNREAAKELVRGES